jgi:quercetin dioxygenase-like cupin family protein
MTRARFVFPLTGLIVLLALLAATPLSAREAGVAEGVTKKELSVEPLAGDPAKQVVTDYYSFPPGTVLPWHIHPGAHEIAYVLSGDLTMEIEGEPVKHLNAGESFYLHPDKVHRGRNDGAGPVELFVVRIKPADQPLTVEVDPPKTEGKP